MLTAIVRCIQSILVSKYCQEIKGISRAVGRSLWYKENLQCMEENMSTGGSLERAEVELAVHKIPLRKCTQYEYMNTLPGENSEMIQGCAYRILQICIDCWPLLQDLQTTSLRLHTLSAVIDSTNTAAFVALHPVTDIHESCCPASP